MATAKPESSARVRQHRRWFGAKLVAAGLALLVAALALGWSQFASRATVAAAYGARIGCACRFVAGRELGDCRQDFEAGMGLTRLSEDPADRAVTARYLLFASQTARFREGAGCVLDPWRGG